MDNIQEPVVGNEKKMRKNYSLLAFLIAAYGVFVTILQLIMVKGCSFITTKAFGFDITDSNTFSYFNIIIPMYLIGFPLLLLITSKMEKADPEEDKLKWGFGKYIVSVLLMFGLIGLGMLIGMPIHTIICKIFGISLDNSSALADLLTDSNPFIRILTVGILAPIVEEFIFRKILIDRTVKYGELVAIISSGMMFGLFHGNFQQAVFAGFIGCLFAYIYVRTRNIWNTIALHMTLNLMTSAVTISLIEMIDINKCMEYADITQTVNIYDPQVQQELIGTLLPVVIPIILLMVWVLFLFLLVLAGAVTWIVVLARKKVVIKKKQTDVKSGVKYAWINIGMVVFMLYIIATFVLSYLSLAMSMKIQ